MRILLAGAIVSASCVFANAQNISQNHDWNGAYLGAHISVASLGSVNDGCSDFTNLTGEDGVVAPNSSAADPLHVIDVGYSNSVLGFGRGCQNVELHGNRGGGKFPTFNNDGDYVALVNGFEGNRNTRLGLGGQVGINQKLNNVVLGLEADITGYPNGENEVGRFQVWDRANAAVKRLRDFDVEARVTNELDWTMSLRSRLGFVSGNQGRLLSYVTAGMTLASSSIKGSVACTPSFEFTRATPTDDHCLDDYGFESSDTLYQVGPSIGAGLEYAFDKQVSFSVEYSYTGFLNSGDIKFRDDNGRSYDIQAGLDDLHAVKFKINFRN